MIELCEEPLGEVIEYCPDIAPEQDSTMAMKLALQSSPERDVVLGVQVELLSQAVRTTVANHVALPPISVQCTTSNE